MATAVALALAPAPALGRTRPERKPDKRTAAEEADLEFMAYCDEVFATMEELIHERLRARCPNCEFVLTLLPHNGVVQRAARIARKAVQAKAEIRRLRGATR